VAILDPLAFTQTPDWADVPSTGGEMVVFHDLDEGRNSKLALIFSDAAVSDGADVGTCMVNAGMASVFTPATHAATTAYYKTLKDNPYHSHFQQFDDPKGGERKIVALPDGTPVPYVHSGWGDGAYPVFTLTDAAGKVCAIYADFMGKNDDKDDSWLTPPGVTLD
jgi:hypothetical protein